MFRLAQIAIWSFIFTVPWEDALLLPGLGTGARVAGGIALPLGLIGIIYADRWRGHPMLFWMAAFFCSTALSMFWAANSFSPFWTVTPGDPQLWITSYVQLLIMVWLLLQLLDRVEAIRTALLAFVLGSYVAAIATVQAFSSGQAAAYQRYAAQGFDPNDLGVTLALGMAVAWYLAFTGRGWHRLVSLPYLPLGLFAILLTASRSATLAAAVACFVPLMLIRRPRNLLYVLAAVSAAVVIAVQFVPESSFERISTIPSALAEGDLSGRTEIWSHGLEVLSEKPLFGVGSGEFRIAMVDLTGRGDAPHNVFLVIAAEQGLFGFGVFCAILVTVIASVRRLPRADRRFWYVLFGVLLVAFMSLNWELRKPTWIFFALAAAHGNAMRGQQHRPLRQPVLAPAGGHAGGPTPARGDGRDRQPPSYGGC